MLGVWRSRMVEDPCTQCCQHPTYSFIGAYRSAVDLSHGLGRVRDCEGECGVTSALSEAPRWGSDTDATAIPRRLFRESSY